jgi:hypothetical protein
VLVICDFRHKTPRQSRRTLTWPKGPGFSGQNKTTLPVAKPEDLKKIKKEIALLCKGETSGRYWRELMLENVTKIKNAYCFRCPGICRRGIYQNEKGEEVYRKSCLSAYFYVCLYYPPLLFPHPPLPLCKKD